MSTTIACSLCGRLSTALYDGDIHYGWTNSIIHGMRCPDCNKKPEEKVTKRKKKEKRFIVKISVATTADVTIEGVENYVLCMLRDGIFDLRHDDTGCEQFPNVAEIEPADFVILKRAIIDQE